MPFLPFLAAPVKCLRGFCGLCPLFYSYDVKLVTVATLSAVLIFLVVQIWYFYGRGELAGRELDGLRMDIQRAQAEQEALRADAEYYGNSANLEKELRSRFNYKLPEETMIVIVPQTDAADTQPSP